MAAGFWTIQLRFDCAIRLFFVSVLRVSTHQHASCHTNISPMWQRFGTDPRFNNVYSNNGSRFRVILPSFVSQSSENAFAEITFASISMPIAAASFAVWLRCSTSSLVQHSLFYAWQNVAGPLGHVSAVRFRLNYDVLFACRDGTRSAYMSSHQFLTRVAAVRHRSAVH